MRAARRSRTASPTFPRPGVALFRSLSSLFVAVLAATLISFSIALPAAAVIIDSGDGSGNTTAPPDDPGFANVGVKGSLSVVYLRNGWVLTANHVGVGDIWLDGSFYSAVPDSGTQLADGGGVLADLLVYAVTPIPSLPDLEIRSNSNLPTGEVVLVGHGLNRGAATDTDAPGIWTEPPAKPSPPVEGWYWGTGAALRWGTNTVTAFWTAGNPPTHSFYTTFDEPGDPDHTDHECQTANLDSGGALFSKKGPNWELAGILWASGLWVGQNPNTSALRGNASIAADLSVYRDDILTLTATPIPEPSVVLQLGAGATLLAGMTRRRARLR